MERNKCFLDPDKLLNKDNISVNKITCSLCNGIVIKPVELFCEHLFCSYCLNSWTEKLNDKCPLCKKVIYKKPSISEENQKVLSQIKFSDDGNIYSYSDYINHLKLGANLDFDAGPSLLNHPNDINKNENKANFKCNVCGKVYDNIIEKVQNKYLEKNKKLTEELRKIYEYKRKLQGDIYENKFGKKMPDTTLIDKCKHFSGNYKPIFECCNNAYGCYICHDENEAHEYQISKKVICLLCACIYEGNECPNCKVKQCYERKEI